MMKLTLDLVINGRLPPPLSASRARLILRRAMTASGKTAAVLGLAMLTEKQMAEKNLTYRRKKGPTDVLSFTYPTPRGSKVVVGDILICPKYAAKLAKEEGIPVSKEYADLLIHGWLHLTGMDHVKPAQAKRMFALQKRIAQAL
jgi:probable rRNA maturation factor